MAEMASPRTTRAASVSSTGTASTTGAFSFIPRYTPRPEPAYISAQAAAEHITHQHHHEQYDLLSPTASPTNDAGAAFSDSSLALLNVFLDSLLYNFLAKARGTSLKQLRPAIVEVLKTRLGRDALASADEELQGLISEADSDAENGDEPANADYIRFGSPSNDWHLESAFKRMRLRVMVFIRLGDFDDEDEEKVLDQDHDEPFPQDMSFLSSPAAVYLASVLEYLAEQTLSLAGDAAYSRSRSKARRTIAEDRAMEVVDEDGVVVEDTDVEKIALNPSLGRLWRIWRKNSRGVLSPINSGRRTPHRQSISSPTRNATEETVHNGMRQASIVSYVEEPRDASLEEIPEGEPSETDIAANIPLPIMENDVNEIQVPGLAKVIYDEGEERSDLVEEPEEPRWRPRSDVFHVPGSWADHFAEAESQSGAPTEGPTLQERDKETARAEEEGAKMEEPDVEEPDVEERGPAEDGLDIEDEGIDDEGMQMNLLRRMPLSRQRSRSVPTVSLIPWTRWSESFRAAMAALGDTAGAEINKATPTSSIADEAAGMSGEDVEQHTEDSEKTNGLVEPSSVLIPSARASKNLEADDTVSARTVAGRDLEHASSPAVKTARNASSPTENNTLVDKVENLIAEPAAEDEPQQETILANRDTTEADSHSAKEQDHPSVGIVAGALAGAAAMVGVAYSAFSPKQKSPSVLQDDDSDKPLSVQTKEMFDPDEAAPDSQEIVDPEIETADVPRAFTSSNLPVNGVNGTPSITTAKDAVTEPFVPVVSEPGSRLSIAKGTSRVASPTLSPKDSLVDSKRDSLDRAYVDTEVEKTKLEVREFKRASRDRFPVVVNDPHKQIMEWKRSSRESAKEKAAAQAGERPGSGLEFRDSRRSSKEKPATAPYESNRGSSKDNLKSSPERKDTTLTPTAVAPSTLTTANGVSPSVPAAITSDSPVSPTDELEQQMPPPNVRTVMKPLPMAPTAIPVPEYDPYNEDSDAIGVARTSNVPIHSPSPQPPADQRPWTPNRGAVTRSAERSPERNATTLSGSDSTRGKVGPSPLRSVSSDLSAAQTLTDQPPITRTVVSIIKKNDLDVPVSEKGLLESPIIPKFEKQPLQQVQPVQPASQLPHSFEGVRPTSATLTQSSQSGDRATPTRHSPRGSQGSTGTAAKSSLDKRSEEAKQREFDALLAGKETVKYTLTPEEIRDVGPYPAKASLDRKVPAAIDTTRTAPISSPRSPTLVRRSPPQVPPSPKRPMRISDIRKSISALSPEPTEPRQRRSGLMARDARISGGDIKDFVDFVRSTGPSSEPQVVPLVLPNRNGSLNGSRQGFQSNMTPREADVGATNNSDLIDFIRNGPSPTSGNANRSSLTGASVRNSKESVGHHIGVSGLGHMSSVSGRPSVNGSGSSGTPLATNDKSLPPHPSKRAPGYTSNAPRPQPTRKQRRVKDPYAIDSDDEDDFATALPSQRELGSLGGTENMREFLRSTSPARANGHPTGHGARAPQNNAMGQSAVNGAAVPRGRSNTGSSVHSAPSPPQAKSAVEPSPLSNRNSHPTLATGLKMRLEARSAGATRAGFGGRGYHYSTNDMADFIRTSAPPDKPVNRLIGAPSPDIPLTKKSSGRGLKFWQRKTAKA